MRKIKTIRIVYRNKFLFAIRKILPKSLHTEILSYGKWNPEVELFPGKEYEIRCRGIRATRLIEAIVFVAVIGGK